VIGRGLAALLCALLALPAAAQNIVTSGGPERAGVTLYRSSNVTDDDSRNTRWLDGYAFVTETRRITLPAGEAEIRFEGVAGGIIPQSAIVSGLPDGVVERNRDAMLLSPDNLLDRSLGRRVSIRRTSMATGAVTETEAIVRSGADGAVVLQTPEGNEALRCTGLPETLVYRSLPGGLSARPTLSVRTRATRPVTATVTLSYLSTGFDWRAYYVATLAPDGTSIDLLAWLTLSSTDETSFVNANLQAVAGQLNREEVEPQPREGRPLSLQCWPAATTSDIPLEQLQRMDMGRGLQLRDREERIVVTGRRMGRPNLSSVSPMVALNSAEVELLGDVKLYRIPEPVTLASNSQKQIAFMNRQRVRVRFAFRQHIFSYNDGDWESARLFMLSRNSIAEGLGEPLPAGNLVLFTQGPENRPFVLTWGRLTDRAVGEDVEIEFGESPTMNSNLRMLSRTARSAHYALVVGNDQPVPLVFEGELHMNVTRANARLGRRNGRPLWRVTVPANGRVTLCFTAAIDEDTPRASTDTGVTTCASAAAAR